MFHIIQNRKHPFFGILGLLHGNGKRLHNTIPKSFQTIILCQEYLCEIFSQLEQKL